MEIKKTTEEIFSNAKKKGFHDDYEIITKMTNAKIFTADEILRVKYAFLSQRMMLAVSEIGEAMEALRKKNFAKLGIFGMEQISSNEEFMNLFEDCIKDSVEDEIADAGIRILELFGHLDENPETFMKLKMKYNSLREQKHGKDF